MARAVRTLAMWRLEKHPKAKVSKQRCIQLVRDAVQEMTKLIDGNIDDLL
jgi:hypothetical protein